MHNEAFREFYSAFTDAEGAISSAETKAGQVEDATGGALTGLGLIAVAKAIQAQTLGLRLVHAEAAGVRTHG